MSTAELIGYALTLLGGGFLTQVFNSWRNRKTDAVKMTSDFYKLWGAEMERLSLQVDKLQVLIGALEAEIIALGGDPIRIRREVANLEE